MICKNLNAIDDGNRQWSKQTGSHSKQAQYAHEENDTDRKYMERAIGREDNSSDCKQDQEIELTLKTNQ